MSVFNAKMVSTDTQFSAKLESGNPMKASFGTVYRISPYDLFDELGYSTTGPVTQRLTTTEIERLDQRIDDIATVDLASKEDVANKVLTITDESTSAQYPSASAVYSALGQKVNVAIDDDETLVFKYR